MGFSCPAGTSLGFDLGAFANGLNAAYGAPAGDAIADYSAYVEPIRPRSLESCTADDLGVVPESLTDWGTRQNWSAFKRAKV